MRYFLVVLSFCVLAFAATFNGPPAFSQRHMGYCDRADSTADTLDCINRHNQDVQKKLNDVFTDIAAGQSDETKALLNDAQKNWIPYRNAQCAWEASLTETASLKRVYELSCLTAMTDRRVALLEAVQSREAQEEPREFSAQPRWMNALAHDHPQIFWRYGEWKSADLDCDGHDEQVMTGLSVAQTQEVVIEKDAVSEAQRQDIEVVVAISENPPTGRPKAALLRLPVTPKLDTPHICRPAIRIDIKDRKTEQADDEEKMAGDGCKMLEISDRTCTPLSISWDEKSYVLNFISASGE
ncbi:MAG: DUF1311 domain-containing protein [Rhodospirillales bacterium]|nr:DUF1311 domain-containing protein [Rhodospirillales bacterium]MCB9997058.1 DUF1311 domain-containing protein [Rhodospirillales bacterium]